MKELLASVTAKGQVTIPAEVRKLMGVSAYDKVAFVVGEDGVRLQKRGSVVAATAGALKSLAEPLSPRELHEAAEEASAEGAVERAP